MAKKLKLMALFQELEGRALVTNRKPVAPASGLYLMQLRALAGHNTLPRRRLTITVERVEAAAARPQPHPVKIQHLHATELPPKPVPTPPTPAPQPAENARAGEPAVSQVGSPRGQ